MRELRLTLDAQEKKGTTFERSLVKRTMAAFVLGALFFGPVGCGTTNGDQGSDPCTRDDADGIVGGGYTFMVTVDDTMFAPTILKAQNESNITLTLKNAGTKPHDLVFSCIATPNNNGCPTKSCFDESASIKSLAPGMSATVMFETPNPEGIYVFKSDLAGDMQTGQFIVQ
jgi:hypothetical protein